MEAYANISQLPYFEAVLISTCFNWVIKVGVTGIIIPKPIISISKVINIKPTAAFLLMGIK
jgi:hypothetical protein